MGRHVTMDGNQAAATVAHRLNEVIAIYPITPSSTMGELADSWSAAGRRNLWGAVPTVIEMQSEGGAAGAVHGALQAGALTTTFTSSQGLLLMLPNMYKIAGELTSTVFHVAARAVATSALSIFADHSDVMAARATGFAILASASVQEVMDLALIAQAATLAGRVPVLHFFDGFRTSHEVMKIEEVSEEDMRVMVEDRLIGAHRARALSPDRPVLRGSAMNPDVFFQAREAVHPFYESFPGVVENEMERFHALTGRRYGLFDYEGAPDAERVLVLLGSGAEAAGETVERLRRQGEKVGVVKVRLFRPFSPAAFLGALPPTARSIAVLDRTKEPGSAGEPLYQDVITSLFERASTACGPSICGPGLPTVIGGRYGLGSKEFTPAMVARVFEELAREAPRRHFTVGITDDVSGTSLDVPASSWEPAGGVFQGVFFGLGADGTVSANRNSIKIIGETTESFVQGYFVYDSKKAGSVTVSHLRVGPEPIRSTYLVNEADFVGCHQFNLLDRQNVLWHAKPGSVLLLNSPYPHAEVWDRLTREAQEEIIRKKLSLWVIDAYRVAAESGMGSRINTIMQVAFFKISGIIPLEQAIESIKRAVLETYGKKGDEVVRRNFAAVDGALGALHAVAVPEVATSRSNRPPVVSSRAPELVARVIAPMIAGRGDALPVSCLPCDGTFPTGTSRWEKRNIGLEIPVWDPEVCIQCGKCTIVCPHTAIRMKLYDGAHLVGAPARFKWAAARGKDLLADAAPSPGSTPETGSGELEGLRLTIQVAPEDCTGCGICVHVCPAKNRSVTRLKAINMEPQEPLKEVERESYEFFLGLPEVDRRRVKIDSVRGSQLLEPLFEASGACSGCGETPYLKLLSQLYGDRLLIANATGCSSIYCGNLPTTPWATNRDGRGPAWSNSLFEDNAEFGLGMRLALDAHKAQARELVEHLAGEIGRELAGEILGSPQEDEADIHEQRLRVAKLEERLRGLRTAEAGRLLELAGALVEKTVWIVGGDGWAYDIGFGGLDHVLASGKDVNVLVLDTEVYSNTGGQMSKATPRGAVAKFAAAGKPTAKKDLALYAMSYGNVYVARVAMGASDTQTVHAFVGAARYHGPSLILAYSHCIAHGINMRTATDNQKAAVDCGHWPLCRYDPERARRGESPLRLDSRPPRRRFSDYARLEARYTMLERSHPEQARQLLELAQEDVNSRWRLYEEIARAPGDGKKRPERAEGAERAKGAEQAKGAEESL